MQIYNPKNWYWVVDGDRSRFWSSANGAYVSSLPPGWFASVQDAVDSENPGVALIASSIRNEIELYDVLAKCGLAAKAPLGPFTSTQIREAFLHIDAEATGAANDESALRSVAESIDFTLPPISG